MSDTLNIELGEDAFADGQNVQFTVSVNGQQVGGVQTVTALQADSQEEDFTFGGNFSSSEYPDPTVTINFVNTSDNTDPTNPVSATEGNLYVDNISYNGISYNASSYNNMSSSTGSSSTSVPTNSLTPYLIETISSSAVQNQPPIIQTTAASLSQTLVTQLAGANTDTLNIELGEDAFANGLDVQFTVSVNGQQVGGVQTVTASHGEGQEESFTFQGDFGSSGYPDPTVTINLVNAPANTNANAGNLYIDDISYNGTSYNAITQNGVSVPTSGAPSIQEISSSSASSISQTLITQVASSGDDTITIGLSETPFAATAAYAQQDVQFTVDIDGQQVGGIQTVTAQGSQQQDFTFRDNLSASEYPTPTVTINFVNAFDNPGDATAVLKVDSITDNGASVLIPAQEQEISALAVQSGNSSENTTITLPAITGGLPVTETAMRAADFVNSIGVNVHLAAGEVTYLDNPDLIPDLQYLGIDNVRSGADGASLDPNDAQLYSIFMDNEALIAAGMQLEMGMGHFDSGTGALLSLSVPMAVLEALEQYAQSLTNSGQKNVGGIYGVEGLNETDENHLTLTNEFQQELSTAVANAVASGQLPASIAVDSYTYLFGPTSMASQEGNISDLSTNGNAHVYSGSAPPNDLDSWFVPQTVISNPNNPYVVTETGYSTASMNEDVQAKYTLDDIFDLIKDGAQKVYLYELLNDGVDPGLNSSEANFGLFNTIYNSNDTAATNTPKEVATAIHNLTTLLADPGSTASGFTPGSLTYSITGLNSNVDAAMLKQTYNGGYFNSYITGQEWWAGNPAAPAAYGNSLLLEKSDGEYDLAVWQEPEIWDIATGTEITVSPTPVTVTLAQTAADVEVFDPLTGQRVETLNNVNTITLDVTDHPLIVEIGLNASIPLTAANALIQPVVGPIMSAATETLTPAISSATGDVTLSGTVSVPGLSSLAGTATNVEVYDGTTDLGAATIQANGYWSYAKPLPQGVNGELYAVATDNEDNDAVLTYNSAAGEAITLSGTVTALPGTTVEIYNVISTTGADGTVTTTRDDLGAATVNGANWTYTTTALTPGQSYSLAAVATDPDGNAATTIAEPAVAIDPPSLDIYKIYQATSPTHGTYQVYLQGTITSPDENTTVQIENGNTAIGTAGVTDWEYDSNTGNWVGTWNEGLNLSAGQYTLQAVATDDAAGKGALGISTNTLNIAVDSPSLNLYAITTPSPSQNGYQVYLQGQITSPDDNTTVQIEDNNTVIGTAGLSNLQYDSTTGNWSGAWNDLVYLPAGQNALQAIATSKTSGQGISNTLDMPISEANPSLNLYALTTPTSQNGYQVYLQGQITSPDDNTTVQIEDNNSVIGTAVLSSSQSASSLQYDSTTGNWSGGYNYLATLSVGQNELQAVATNEANGQSTSNTLGILNEAVNYNQLWLEQSGSNLVVDVLGTGQQTVIDNLFSGGQLSQQQQIASADGYALDANLQGLVQAMATFSQANPGFNPAATSHTTLADSYFGSLSATVAADWHKA